MTDPNDLRKVETWLRDCKADLWMAECCEDAADEIARLRLTDEERESLAFAATFIDENYAMGAGDTLRNLLVRLA